MAPILANRPGNAPFPAAGRITGPAARPTAGFHDLWPALALGLTGLIWLVGVTLAGAGAGGQLLVIGPPALDRDRVNGIVWRAGGAVVSPGGLPNIAIAVADQPDFASALTAAGAWLVLPSPRLLGCFSDSGAGAE